MLRVAKWNFDRNNTSFDLELEKNMLAEEAQEFKDGMVDYLNAIKGIDQEAILDAKVEMVDAYADFAFVYQGTRFKALGTMMDFSGVDYTLDYMEMVLKDANISHMVLDAAFDAVVAANEAKGTQKVNGKIQKGADWVDPKSQIRMYLQDV